jgi:hypothetical protein
VQQGQDPKELLEWLARQVPFIEALVRSTPSDSELQSAEEPLMQPPNAGLADDSEEEGLSLYCDEPQAGTSWQLDAL